MDFDYIVREWFYRLPKGYADAPYTEEELRVLDKVLAENNITMTEVDIVDQAFLDAKPVEDLDELQEAIVRIGGKTFQLNNDQSEKLISFIEKDLDRPSFNPMARGKNVKGPKRKLPVFAEDESWQEWVTSVEGIIPDEKLQKLYFVLYDITSNTFTTNYIQELLDEIYNADPNVLANELFSLSTPDTSEAGYKIPDSLLGIADINTLRGGSKGSETGRGEFLIPLIFDSAELGGSNAPHDVYINGDGWHVKELKTRNTYIRLGMGTFPGSELGKLMSSKVGLSTKEFNPLRVEPALTTPISPNKLSVIDALNEEYGDVSTPYDALMKIQSMLDDEMRELAIEPDNGNGLIFYVAENKTMYFVPTEKCISGGATVNAHTVGMSYSDRPYGKFASAALKYKNK